MQHTCIDFIYHLHLFVICILSLNKIFHIIPDTILTGLPLSSFIDLHHHTKLDTMYFVYISVTIVPP